LSICNRGEQLVGAPGGRGYRCDWRWTSDLHATRVFPPLGRWVMSRALRDHPFAFAEAPTLTPGAPEVSFLLGHRGREREPLLRTVLASIAAQRDVRLEAIVVEQSARAELQGTLPPWVTYIHTPTPADAPYNRAWAFNVAARMARAPVLVLHDNDFVVPRDYARCVLDEEARGADVVNLKRFNFYLSQQDTRRVVERTQVWPFAPVSLTQNLTGGGSLAIRADTYARLGGMDEGFVGWGGEDNEFWERCGLARRWDYGYLSLVHLWHPPQPQKSDGASPTLQRYQRLSTVEPGERVRRLAGEPRGGSSPRASDPFAQLLKGT
jgi:hypothetical protein